MKWYFIIFAIIVVSESAKKNSISRLSIPLKSRAQNGYLRWLKQDTSPLKLPGVANGIQRVIKRAMRDLRVPFRANRPADNRPMRQSPQHGQTPIKAFSHPKLQPVLLSEVQSQQQQRYYPDYGTNHGSRQQSTRTHNRYNQQEQSRLQPPRRPMRLPNNDGMPRHPPMYNSQNSNSAAQQRAPFRQSSAASIPVPSLQSNPSLNRFPQNINGKAINPTPQMHGHPQKNRVIDVYHHIPVTQRPNHNMHPNVPLLHESQPLVSSHSQPSIQKFTSQANRPMSPGFISSEPVKHHHNHRQSQPGIAPQRFPGSEHQNANRFPPRSFPGSYKNENTNQRLPVVPPPNFHFQKENPFGQINPFGNLNKHQNIQKVNTEIVGDDPYDTVEDDDDQYKSGSQNIEESHLQINRPKVPLRDFVSDDELRVVHTVEENPLNKTGTVKKYWDFRQENFGLTSSQTSKATALEKSNISPVLAVSDQSKIYQDVKPVVMPHMKENINLETKLSNGFSDLVRTIKPERLPAINDEKNMKYKNISKEFYHIDNKPKLAFEPIVDLPPQFMSIETSSIEQSTRSSAADSVNVPNLQNHKMHSDHNKNNFESSSVPGPTISSNFLERIPIVVVNKSSEPEHTQNPKYLPDIHQNHNGNTNSDPVLQWSHDIKYIPAEIFRKNSTMNTENGYHNLRDSFSDVSSLKAPETLPDHSVAPFGINVRNKAQYQKFEDTTTSAEYPIDVEDESSETEPRKYFRGPQHINNNWTIFEELPVTNFAYRRLISTSIPYFSSWIASATTAMPHETVTRHMLQDNSQSMSRKIINAWNLANKVLGRRNNTRLLYPSLASSTEKPEFKRLKFTYSPLPRTSAERASDVLVNNSSKRFFNFRTGTTQSVLDSLISAESKFTENTPKSSELPITDESKEFDKTTSSPRSNERFSFNITSNANRALERINARRNQSMASKGDKRPYYINLKPVTRPYSSSVTNYPAVVSSENNTNPSSVFTVQMTTKSPDVSSTQKYINPSAVFSTQKYTNPPAVFSTQKYTTPPAAFSTQKYTNPPVVISTQKYTNPPVVSSTQKYTNPPAVFSAQKYKTTESESKHKSSFVTESTVRKFTLAKHKPMFSSPTTSPKRESTTEKTPSTKGYRKIGLSTMYATPPTLPILSTAFEDEVTTPPNTEGFSTEPNTESIIGATLDEYVNPTEIDEIEAVTETEKHYATKLPASPLPNNNSIHETATEMIDQEQLIVDTLKSTKIKMQEMMSKGLRHLMPMVMGLSSDVSISSDCTFSLLRWLRGIRGLEQWAIKKSVRVCKPQHPYLDKNLSLRKTD
ncbi:hypothetical protein AVEN_10245-1 [Araneus ventricosus]|uniref:Uncharacterized protein n=1 Tax=Araneus ventricosus TaxID=182803 RepID=A0A4Y2FI85_ARAVE|nr:hypothetical protein AVEN_10245-1 [Araneus ventricosus]